VCAHSFFGSSLIELIAGRSEHANESGKKTKKKKEQEKNGTFIFSSMSINIIIVVFH
jgi:hypothetical protein